MHKLELKNKALELKNEMLERKMKEMELKLLEDQVNGAPRSLSCMQPPSESVWNVRMVCSSSINV